MWQLRACNITQDVTNRGQHISMVPVRWVEGQKEDMVATVRNIQNLVVKTPVKMIKSGVAFVNEDLQIKMWEMGWVVVLLVEKRVGQVKNMIIDTVEMAVGVVEMVKENPVNGILNSQKRPQSLEIMRNEKQMKYKEAVSKEYRNKKYAETDQFSLSDVDTKVFNLEKEIEEYEVSIKKLQDNIGENIEIFLAGKDNITVERQVEGTKMEMLTYPAQNMEETKYLTQSLISDGNSKGIQDEGQVSERVPLLTKDYLQSLQASCSLTDIPDDLTENINMRSIHFTPTTVSNFQQLCENQVQGRFHDPDMFAMLCARRWKSQHVVAWCKGDRCNHYSQDIIQDMGSG